MPDGEVPEPEVLSLSALGWILQDDKRAERLLSLTGLTPDRLRGAIEDRSVQVAILEFLISHEPDLIAASVALGVEPADLVTAHTELSR